VTSCARCRVILGLPTERISTLWVKWAGTPEMAGTGVTKVNLCARCDAELLDFLAARLPTAASRF
jgi:hypothetical protein